jgi:RNA polymerase sigma-70 factor, ECF subfamily
MGVRPTEGFDPKVAELIRVKVRSVIGRYGFTRSDEDDLAQELSMHVVEQMPKYDPARASPQTFADRIVTNKLASIIGHRTAQKRDRRREVPADRAPEPAVADGRDRDARLDVRQTLAGLPDDLRHVAQLLAEHTLAEVVRIAGLTRQQVRTVRHRIGQHLRSAGLGPDSTE